MGDDVRVSITQYLVKVPELLTMISVATVGLVNGGIAGLIWVFLFAWMGFLLVNISMAEMGSMCAYQTSPGHARMGF